MTTSDPLATMCTTCGAALPATPDAAPGPCPTCTPPAAERGFGPRNPKVPMPVPAAGLYPAKTPPTERGEAAVWRALGSQRPKGWTIWHHLVVGRGPFQAEVDFVVAVPGKGLVLIECKAGTMTRRDHRWHQNGHFMKTQPGEQLERARKSVLHALRNLLAPREMPEIAIAVCFPETSAPDERSLDAAPILFAEDLHWFDVAGHKRLLDAFSGRTYPPSERFIGALHTLWGPDWWPVRSLTRSPDRAEVAWRQLTVEQVTVLNCLSESRRLLVEGPPGSGKTLLVMALAERLQRAGKRVFVGTFTKAIAAELHRTGLKSVFPVRDWALEQARVLGVVPADADERTWRTPEWAAMVHGVAERVRSGEVETRWDIVLIDEYQDLGAEDWTLVEALVGDETALWLFGDDAQRALSHAQGVQIPDRLAPGGVFRLHSGLRCPPALVALATRLLHGTPASDADDAASTLSECLRVVTLPDDADAAAREAALETALEAVLAEPDVRTDDVAVLSFGSKQTRRLRGRDTLGRHALRLADDQPTPGALLSDTVLRAKGLERPIVVLTDLDLVRPAAQARALYIGLTRASWRCVVIGTRAEVARLG
jgi:hypothetical protein